MYISKFSIMLVKVSTLELLYLSLLVIAVVSDQINNKSEKITRSGEKNKTLCEMTSTHRKQFIVKNVCMTEDYSIFDELSQSSRPRLDLVFIDKKVVNVDEKKKEITLDLLFPIFWRDERIKAFFKPGKTDILLPPVTLEHQSEVWSPFPFMLILNIRNRRYLQDPNVAFLDLSTADSLNGTFENISFSGDVPIVNSFVYWSITFSCSFDFTQFPFDKTTCPFVIKFIGMDVTLGFTNRSVDGLIKQNDIDGFKIEMEQVTPPKKVFEYGLCFTDVTVNINVERQPSKYIYQYYIPCITIVTAASFSFIIPLSAIPGRVALIVTQFLTLTNIFINQMVSLAA